jgi:serine/threonine-protein kinase
VSLHPGTVLGPYEVTDQIGVGGMGEVYRATDTRLKRAVAIKVLPDSVAADTERLVRFQREAEVLASLNHPNIATIFGFEDAGPVRALVMELVEGPTLADRIAQGALPVDEALALAKQIAEALEAAHEQGVIHRDLKPANVKVRADGTVKLLDFGLAKLNERNVPHGVGAANLSMSPTLTSPVMTGAGVILGTAAYMSPEQARGRTVDARADIWAFGVVLYEMLSGKRAFDGEDATEVLGAVVRLDADMEALPAQLPARIRQVIRACLQKNVKQRVAHIQDVRLALEGTFETPVAQPAGAAVTTAPPLWRRALPLVATAVVAAAIAGSATWRLRAPDPLMVSRSLHVLPQGRNFLNPVMNIIAVSGDGRQFMYNSTGGVFARRLDELEDRLILGATNAGIFSPFFSPDGQSVGYFYQNDQSLRQVSITGGPSQRITSLGGGALGGSWAADGTILYGQSDGIWQVSGKGGDARRLIATKDGERAFYPRRLPGDDWILFTLTRPTGDAGGTAQANVVAASPASGERRVLKTGASDGRYVSSGHLLYLQEAVLYAVPFDVRRLEETGVAVPVVQGVMRANALAGSGAGFYDVSTRGTLVYVPGAVTGAALSTLAWVDSSGRQQAIELRPGLYRHPRLSPDGQWLAVERQDRGGADIWLYETSGTTAERRLTEGGNNRYPVWSRDGSYVLFQSSREGGSAIFRQRADGSGDAEQLTKPAKGVEHIPEDWSPTEDRLVFSVISGSGVELWMFTLGDRAAARVGMLRSTTPFNAVFSPNGKWMAYTERANGVRTYLQSVTGSIRQQIGEDAETVHHPLFSGNRLLYFAGGNGAAVSRTIVTEPTIKFGRPEPFLGDALPLNVQPSTSLNHDAGKDGRFVTVLTGTLADDTRPEIVVVQNWFEELKRLAPAGTR